MCPDGTYDGPDGTYDGGEGYTIRADVEHFDHRVAIGGKHRDSVTPAYRKVLQIAWLIYFIFGVMMIF